MHIIQSLQNGNFIECVKKNLPAGGKIFLYIKTWQDGEEFLDLCKDDGGLKTEQLEFYKQKDSLTSSKTVDKILGQTKNLIELKAFSSKNGKYVLGFDLFIIAKNKYFVISPVLNQGYYAKLNLFNRIFGFVFYKEPWESKKFGYWEEQDNKQS